MRTNLLGVLGVLLASDVPFAVALEALSSLTPPSGRMQRLGGDGKPLVVVDYAHTPDALEKVLRALRPASRRRDELICVFGCGGDRDTGKRPEMGRIAAELADRLIVTTDNPRSEDPAEIANDIVRGIRQTGAHRWTVVLDRAAAIHDAIAGGNRARHRARSRAKVTRRTRSPKACDCRSRTRSKPRPHWRTGAGKQVMDTVAAAQAVAGRVIGTPVVFARVTTDSRAIHRGDLFRGAERRALRRPRLRGARRSALAPPRRWWPTIVPRALFGQPDRACLIHWRRWASSRAYWRASFGIPIVAVVGSNGKTTTKEMIAAIFRAAVGSRGHARDRWELQQRDRVAADGAGPARFASRSRCIEIGMNHRGETRELAAIARPTIALVTNAQREHQEFMRSVA